MCRQSGACIGSLQSVASVTLCKCVGASLQAKMPEPQPDAVPRFGPAAKAARAKEREAEQAKLKAQQRADAATKK